MPISKAISQARPDHPSLDYDVLRAEGLRHLENFATEMWTDYNAHDPGITLLELLCYAITDLGYRTRMLPVEDLLADSDRQHKPWYTAAEVLPSSPVTALDYRKLLIDVAGVKNAWILRGKEEMGIKSLGLVFPELSDEKNKLDKTKIKDFLKKNWSKIFTHPIPGELSDAQIDELIEKIDEEKKQIETLSKIKQYVDAIGTKDNKGLDNLAKLELREHLASKGISVGDSQINRIHQYILWYPNNKNLPLPEPLEDSDDQRRLLIEIPKLLTVYTTLDEFLSTAINKFNYIKFFTDSGTEIEYNENDISNLILFLLDEAEPRNLLDGAVEKLYDLISESAQFPGQSLGMHELRRRWLMQQEYIRIIGSGTTLKIFPDIYNFYKNDLIHRDKFLEGRLADTYFDDSNSKWKLDDRVIESFIKKAFGEIEDEVEKKAIELQILNYYRSDIEASGDVQKSIIDYLFNKKFCDYGLWGLSINGPGEDLPLGGLYTVLLDLGEDIYTDIPNEVNPVLARVKKVLHANRGLCEDFTAIKVVEERPIGVCLELEVDPEADEVEVFAEAIRLMQEYLSPVPRFRTFAARLEELNAQGKNNSAENVYNGPLLANGFLDDAELGEDLPRSKYFHSDLLHIVMTVKGVVGVTALKVNASPEQTSSSFLEKTEYFVYDLTNDGEFPDPSLNNQAPYCKPVIDLGKSRFSVTKGVLRFDMNVQYIHEKLKLFRLINAPDPLEPPGGPTWNEGRYRPDLADYQSLQYDLPATYAVGKHSAAVAGNPGQKAQNKHLQVYLAFYDQILAAYLAQLGRVRRLLSVDQKADDPTRVLPLLYELPGIRDIIGVNGSFEATEDDWKNILATISDEKYTISKIEGNKAPVSDNKLMTSLLETLRKKTHFAGFIAFRKELQAAFAGITALHNLYAPGIEDYFWRQFTAKSDNPYAKMVLEMAESPAVRQRRRNQLLDHLIARFGEEFSAYAAALLRPEAEPEDNPRQQNFQEYLESKTDFLREIAALAHERNRAYNYLAYNHLEKASDVWNTKNVSGLQKRVIRKLGIPSWETRSLIAEPAYRIDLEKGTNNRGLANYYVALRRQLPTTIRENPEEAVPLLYSPPYNSSRTAQNKINDLYKIIWQAHYYEIKQTVPSDESIWFGLMPAPGGKFRGVLVQRDTSNKSKTKISQGSIEITVDILLQSDPLSEDEARNRVRDKVKPLVEPSRQERENEGFHIVEHILLRPLENDDDLLQLPLGCEPEETPKEPYSFWITVIAPAQTTRFADLDFRSYFEHEFRLEMPAHLAARFCYLELEDMYRFEEAFAVWMFEKAKCSKPNYCKVDEAAEKLIAVLNSLPCTCVCAGEEPRDRCA